MNIFVLDPSPVLAAQLQCDKHVVKMIVESAQMLSTAHRMLDGKPGIDVRTDPISGKSRRIKIWTLDGSIDSKMYAAVHTGHPCTVWTMMSDANYRWHYDHFVALCDEYTHRYGKVHNTDSALRSVLRNPPTTIQRGPITPFPLAMKSNPECMDFSDPVASYRKFYQTKQARFKMSWTKRNVPDWFVVTP